MSRVLTPTDAHALMNQLVNQATGQQSITVVDTSTFVSAGETVLATGVENTINSLGLIIGRTLMSVRPYKAKLAIINALNSGAYSNRIRKISYYARENEASGDWNTQLKTNLGMGLDNGVNTNGTKSMWEQNQPVALEMNFGGSNVWETSTTIYQDQLKEAFESEANFNTFVSGIMTEKANDIESTKEAYNRMTVLNHMAGVYDLTASMPGSAVDMVKAFNDFYGTSYTGAELRSTHLSEFLAFFVAKFKLDSDYMTERSSKYHWSPKKTVNGTSYTLLRHTPKDKQRCMLYAPFFTVAKASVYPEIFNTQYLDMDKQFEAVNFWQSIDTPEAINITPAIPDVTLAGGQTAGDAVSLKYVLGCLFDEDALMVDYQIESAESTPLEARKRYRNLWWTFKKNSINDFTENFILYYMAS